jgi:hypothetical protein
MFATSEVKYMGFWLALGHGGIVHVFMGWRWRMRGIG